MVIKSRDRLPSLAPGVSLPPADQLFPRLAEEAQRGGPETSVALSYGKVGG